MNKYIQYMKGLNYFLFFVLVAALPYPRTIVEWCWGAWAVSWLLELRFLQKGTLQWSKRMAPVIFLFVWVVWECISLLWGQEMGVAHRFPDYHISLLFFPLIALFGVNELYDWKKIAKVFIISCIGSFFVYSWLLYWVGNYEYLFTLHGNGEHLPMDWMNWDYVFSTIKHRMLYCSALGMAIILLFMLRKDLIQDLGKLNAYIVLIGGIMVMLTAIILTGSRANIIALIVLGIVAWIGQIKRHRAVWGAVILLVGIGCLYATWHLHPRMKALTIDHLIHVEINEANSMIYPRLVIWKLAAEEPHDYVAAGLGVGNVKTYMTEKYSRENLEWFVYQRYGAHSQYLNVCMELGIVAMILFILCWCYIPACYPKNSQARLFMFYFVLLFGLNMLTDDNLSRIEGVIYTCVALLLADQMVTQGKNKELSDSSPLARP